MGKRIMAVLAVVACAMAGMLSVPVAAEAKTVKSTGTWAGASYTVYDDWSATVTGRFTSKSPGRAPEELRQCDSVDVSGVDVSGVVSMDEMFEDFWIEDISGLANWDVSHVTSMNQMFYNCYGLTDISGLASWDTSHVTSMFRMFYDCVSLADVSGLASWDTSSVTNMGSMFQYCSSLADASGLASWDTSSVTDVSHMFQKCSKLATLSMEGWDTSNVLQNQYYTFAMFDGCSNLSSVTLGPKVTSSVVRRLPTPPTTTPYTGRWVREDGSYGPYTVDDLASDWNGDTMSGTWVWETVSYRVSLDANGGTGTMAQLRASPSVTVPAPAFRRLGYRFVGWNTAPTGTGTSYLVGATLTPTADVTLYAQWLEMPTTARYADGMDVTLRAGEQVTIEGLSAGASYVVTETPVPSGWTLVRSRGTTGVIVPSVR